MQRDIGGEKVDEMLPGKAFRGGEEHLEHREQLCVAYEGTSIDAGQRGLFESKETKKRPMIYPHGPLQL